MELVKSMKTRIETMVRRHLKVASIYYVEMMPFVPPLAAYYEAAAKDGLSRHDRDTLRLNTYEAVLPELRTCFEELMRDWEGRMSQEKPDLGINRIAAVKLVALILFLTDI